MSNDKKNTEEGFDELEMRANPSTFDRLLESILGPFKGKGSVMNKDGTYPEVPETKDFLLEDVLSVTSGRIINPKGGLTQVHDIMHYMLGGGLPLSMSEMQFLSYAVRDAIYVQVPNLEKIDLTNLNPGNFKKVMELMRKEFGATITLRSSGRSQRYQDS